MNAMLTAAPSPSFPTTVRRLVAFDLRRFRLLALLLVSLEIVRAACVEWGMHIAQPAPGGPSIGMTGDGATTLLDFALAVTTAVTTAVSVQADQPSDDRAFWRTRPIAPLALAAGKLTTFVLLFAVVPSTINAMRLVAYGAPPASIAAASLQILVEAGAIVAPSWALALATRTLPRFLAAVVALIVGLSLAFGALTYWMMRGGVMARVGIGGFGFEWQGAGSTPLATGVVTALAFAILVAHYRLRRRLAATLAAVVLVGAAQWLPHAPASPDASADLAAIVAGRLRWPPSLGVPSSWAQQAAVGWPVYLTGRIEGPMLPPDVSAGIRLTRTEARVDGRTIEGRDVDQCCLGIGPVGAIGPDAVPGPPAASVDAVLFGVVPDQLRAIAGRQVSVRADAQVTFARHRVVAALPLRPGATFRREGSLLDVVGLEPSRRFLTIRAVRFPTFAGGDTEGLSLFIADRDRRHVITTTPAGPIAPRSGAAGSPAWAQGRTWSGRFDVLLTGVEPVPSDAQLLIVETRPAGVARTTLSGDVQVAQVVQ